MLPPGIYLWESGLEGVAAPSSVDTVSTSAPGWAADLELIPAWSKPFEIDGCGSFRKAGADCETTVIIVNDCGSTMEVARHLVEAGVLGEWGTVLAVQQTTGRGQLRRPWVSPAGNLHASLVLPKAPTAGAWAESYGSLLSLLCGHLFAGALQPMEANIHIKWPNDLLQNDRKVGGMLIEERNGVDILGVGINLTESPSDSMMREDHSVSASVLKTNPPVRGPLALWETLVNRGKILYVVLLGELKPSQFVSAMSGRLAWLGRTILVNEREGQSYQAEILGISPDGGLRIRRAGREEILFSGSITPR